MFHTQKVSAMGTHCEKNQHWSLQKQRASVLSVLAHTWRHPALFAAASSHPSARNPSYSTDEWRFVPYYYHWFFFCSRCMRPGKMCVFFTAVWERHTRNQRTAIFFRVPHHSHPITPYPPPPPNKNIHSMSYPSPLSSVPNESVMFPFVPMYCSFGFSLL